MLDIVDRKIDGCIEIPFVDLNKRLYLEQKERNCGFTEEYIIPWLLNQLAMMDLILGRDTFYIGNVLFTPEEGEETDVAKITHVAMMLLINLKCDDDVRVRIAQRFNDSAMPLMTLYHAARSGGMPVELTEGFIMCWLDEEFTRPGKKFVQFSSTIFSHYDKPSVRRAQLLACSSFLQDAYISRSMMNRSESK